MTRRKTHEERRLAACAEAARARLRDDARALEDRADDVLVTLGVARHPIVASAAAATTGAALGALVARHVDAPLRRGGAAAMRAWSWSSLLF